MRWKAISRSGFEQGSPQMDRSTWGWLLHPCASSCCVALFVTHTHTPFDDWTVLCPLQKQARLTAPIKRSLGLAGSPAVAEWVQK